MDMQEKGTVSPFAQVLREVGYKATPSRVELMEVLEKAGEPLSIQGILKRFKKHTTDQATVYRTLNTLASIGLVREVDLKHAHAHFELNREDDHHHLVCTECGRVEDVLGCDMESFEKNVLKKSKSFKIITHHSLEFFGVCTSCAKK